MYAVIATPKLKSAGMSYFSCMTVCGDPVPTSNVCECACVCAVINGQLLLVYPPEMIEGMSL